MTSVTMTPSLTSKLVKGCRMVGSDHDGESIAAQRLPPLLMKSAGTLKMTTIKATVARYARFDRQLLHIFGANCFSLRLAHRQMLP